MKKAVVKWYKRALRFRGTKIDEALRGLHEMFNTYFLIELGEIKKDFTQGKCDFLGVYAWLSGWRERINRKFDRVELKVAKEMR